MHKIIFSSLALFTCLSLLPACGSLTKKKEAPGPQDKIYSVSVSQVLGKEVPDAIEIKGTFSPEERLIVKSDFSGKVQALSVIEGQQLELGDAILKIEDEKLAYVLDRQRAELREAEAQLDLDTKMGEDIANAMDNVDETPSEESGNLAIQQEEAPLDENLNPNPDEAQNNEATPQPTDATPNPTRPPFGKRAAQRRFATMPSPQNLAVNKPKIAPKKTLTPDQIDSRLTLDQAKVDRIRAEIAISERQLSGSTIVAAVDGFVAKVNVAEGATVKQDDPLIEIVKINPIELILQIPKGDIARVNKDMQVKVSVGDLNQESFIGEISFIGAEIDPVKKTLEMRVRVANPELRIKSGMEGLAYMSIANKTHQALLVPASAVHSEFDKKFVYVVRGQVAEKRSIETGNNIEGMVEVKSGLKNSDKVVTSGIESLKEEEEFIKISS